jgi:hypothetical protein
MTRQENLERPRIAVAGRIVELQRLEACERGLADAYALYGEGVPRDRRWAILRERHLAHAAMLAARIRELGGEPADDSDDEWIVGSPRELSTIVFAEHGAMRTYHDHLADLDSESLTLVRERILPAHERTLAELVGERDFSLEP